MVFVSMSYIYRRLYNIHEFYSLQQSQYHCYRFYHFREKVYNTILFTKLISLFYKVNVLHIHNKNKIKTSAPNYAQTTGNHFSLKSVLNFAIRAFSTGAKLVPEPQTYVNRDFIFFICRKFKFIKGYKRKPCLLIFLAFLSTILKIVIDRKTQNLKTQPTFLFFYYYNL